MHDATAEWFEYLPTAHAMHFVAPVSMPVSVIEPAVHSTQSADFSDPLFATYFPASQLVHDELIDAVEYLPAAHSVHIVAPAADPLSVIDPAAHVMHDATIELVEYIPAAQAVHDFAPAAVPVLVIEPGTHTLQ